jgi:solute carrier family 25 (mitochondrial oxoglutarate transporter), member 11
MVARNDCDDDSAKNEARGATKVNAGAAAWKGFAGGSLGAMASGAVTHPIDLVKVRMQLYGECTASTSSSVSSSSSKPPGMFRTGQIVLKTEGLFGLYKGLSASLLRQATFIGTKFGAYDLLKASARKYNGASLKEDESLPFYQFVGCGIGAGAMGAVVGNPADLAMVRMQADGRLPIEMRRNYRNCIHAMFRVAKDEGVFALWRGSGPTVNRAMIVTASQMAVYDKSKNTILEVVPSLGNGLVTQTMASFVAGVVAALTSNPIDLAKSRLMSMKVDEKTGKMPYTGTFDCLLKTCRTEGVTALYKGLVPTTARQVPLNVVRFVSVEYFRKFFEKF